MTAKHVIANITPRYCGLNGHRRAWNINFNLQSENRGHLRSIVAKWQDQAPTMKGRTVGANAVNVALNWQPRQAQSGQHGELFVRGIFLRVQDWKIYA